MPLPLLVYRSPLVRRPPSILLNAATAPSLVPCVATPGVWGSNAIVMCRRDVGAPDFKRNLSPGGFGGRLALGMGHSPAEIPSGVGRYSAGSHRLSLPTARFDVSEFAMWRGPTGRSPAAPGWLAPLVLALLPGARIAHTYRLRRAERPGLCLACGYDVRATPERCPECGTIPAK